MLFVRTMAMLPAIGLLGACSSSCPDVQSTTERISFTGVMSSISVQSGVCGDDGCAEPATKVLVRALVSGSEVVQASATTDNEGSFAMPLPAGLYDLEVVPPRAPVDRSLEGIEIADGQGLRIVRGYKDAIEPDQLNVTFAATTTSDQRSAVLAANQLSILVGDRNDLILLVHVSASRHPQLVGEEMMRLHPEVVGFSLAFWACPH